MEWNKIINSLKDDPDYLANKELARLVVSNDIRAVNYYLDTIGNPIIKHIVQTITKRDITAEYYIFLSSPFDPKTEMAKWHPVSLYKGVCCRLSSYTSTITCRYFCRMVNKENKLKGKSGGLLDFVDYESLLKCEKACIEETDDIQIKCVKDAYSQLNEKDREVLRLLIIEKKTSIEAFPILSQYITPRPKEGRNPEEIKAKWTDKQKQDAISLIKGRALEHLQNKYSELKHKYIEL